MFCWIAVENSLRRLKVTGISYFLFIELVALSSPSKYLRPNKGLKLILWTSLSLRRPGCTILSDYRRDTGKTKGLGCSLLLTLVDNLIDLKHVADTGNKRGLGYSLLFTLGDNLRGLKLVTWSSSSFITSFIK